MKKILIVGMTEGYGGIETFVMNVFRTLDKKEYQIDFEKSQDKIAYEDEIKKLGGTIYRITARSKNRKKFNTFSNSFFINKNKII